MKVTVKYYAKYRDFSGNKEETLEIENKNLRSVIETVKEKYLKFKNEEINLIALNGRFVKDLDTEVREGDVISLFPPVSGG